MHPSSYDEYAQRHDKALADFDQWIDKPSQELSRLEEFHRQLHSRTPLVFVTRSIVAVNVAVFAVMVLSGVGWLQPSVDDLIEWGANFGPKTLAGQSWRLFTSMFVHCGIIHLAFNMWALANVGQVVERLVGNLAFLVLYVVSGLVGSLASVAWNPSVASEGASGAVFGVIVALLGFILAHRHAVPPSVFQEIRSSMLAFLGYNLLFGISVPGIDMAAHLGGLVAGFACGLVISPPWEKVTRGRRLVRSLAVALVSAIGIAAATAFLPPAPADVLGELGRFSATERQAVETYNAAVKRRNEKSLDDAGFAEVIEREVLPKWREGRQRLEAMRNVPKSLAEHVARTLQYAKLREEAWALRAAALRDHDPAKLRAAERKAREVDALLDRDK